MSAIRFTDLPPALDSDGDTRSGAVWEFYLTGTLTPATVYTTPAMTTAHGATVTANSGGAFPVIYLDPTVTYRAIQKDADGGTLREIDPLSAEGGISASLVSYGAGTLEESMIPTAQRYGAAGNNVADDSAALQDAADTGLCFVVPPGTYKSDTAVTGTYRAISYGADFFGTNPLDGLYPAFGPGALKVIARGSFSNAIIGIAHNTAPPSTLSFPCGVTAYGRNDNEGNQVFGIYAEARQYATTGVVVNEIDSFNMSAPASGNLPPNLGFGTPECHAIGLQVAADGNFDNSIGIQVTTGGQNFQKFLTGIYINPPGIKSFGIYIDSFEDSTYVPLVVKHSVDQTGVFIQAVGEAVPLAPALAIYDDDDAEMFSVLQNGQINFRGGLISTTVGSAGAAAALPAAPSGYLLLKVGGTDIKVPYYAP